MATAPYNFVELPAGILPAPLDEHRKALYGKDNGASREAFKDYIQQDCPLSGTIELEIENLAPFFVGGKGEDFFNAAGEIMIPGSSLRGMFRSLLKIISCGAVRPDEDFYDRHLYYRALMAVGKYPWTRELNKHYKEQLGANAKAGAKNANGVKPGFLVKDKYGEYRIYPYTGKLQKILISQYETQYHKQIPPKDSGVNWHGNLVFCHTGKLGMGRGRRITSDNQYKAIIKDIIDNRFHGNAQRALSTIAREVGKQYIVYFDMRDTDWESSYPVPDEVLHSYIDDIKRGGVDLLNTMKKAKDVKVNLPKEIAAIVPCFYVARDNQIKFFGHGQSFRIPYAHSVGNAVPASLQKDTIDFVDSIFGQKDYFAGRIYFGDAKLSGARKSYETAVARPMLTPNPTSYQLYLSQKSQSNLAHWDTKGAMVRGYKMYWHSNKEQWRCQPGDVENKNIVSKITPLKPGNKFTGSIRFQSLSPVELGALLSVLDIAYAVGSISGKADIAYKLGHGKSIGMGSVRIRHQLQLEQQDAYTRLFEAKDGQNNWYSGEQQADSHEYIDLFKAYMQKHFASNIQMKLSWEKSMMSLCTMLDWRQVKEENWQGRTAYMELEDFMNREILPVATEVYKLK